MALSISFRQSCFIGRLHIELSHERELIKQRKLFLMLLLFLYQQDRKRAARVFFVSKRRHNLTNNQRYFYQLAEALHQKHYTRSTGVPKSFHQLLNCSLFISLCLNCRYPTRIRKEHHSLHSREDKFCYQVLQADLSLPKFFLRKWIIILFFRKVS